MKKITPEQRDYLIEKFNNQYIGHGHYIGDTAVFEVIEKVITDCTEPRNLILELTAHIHTIGIPAESYVEKEQSETFSQGVEVMRKEIFNIIHMLFYPERGDLP